MTIAAVWLALEAAASWLVPWLVAGALVRALASRGLTVPNWRGEPVVRALGVAWMTWAVCIATLAAVWGTTEAAMAADDPLVGPLLAAAVAPVFASPLFLVVGAFALGLLDDAFGDTGSRGLRGHLGALARGELTTGTLKLAGLVALAVVQTSSLAFDNGTGALAVTLTWSLAAASTAGAANLVNLLDLRPCRALKGYVALSALACVALALDPRQAWPSPATAVVAALSLALILVGPAAASWGLDARRRAMLGDAGANAAGALAGYFVALSLPLLWLAVFAALVVAMNLAAERVSFSALIERNRLLRAIDSAGVPHDAEVKV